MKNKGCLFLFLFLTTAIFAQEVKVARESFEQRDFEQALEEYLLLYEEDSTKLEYNYRIGVCYLNTNIDKADAVPYLERAVSMEDHDPNALYLLGRAYHYAYRFDKAIATYQEFKEIGKGHEFNLKNASTQIEYCENAKELMKYPVEVDFKNLGDKVNSLYKDYYPFVPVDESYIVFNSRRDDGSIQNPNGDYTSNVYKAKVKDGEFQKAKPLSDKINSKEGNEEIVGLSAKGDKAIFYMDDNQGYGQGDLYISEVEDGEFKEPKKLPDVINSRRVEIAASITSDMDKIFFASNRKGGYGGIDLYVTRKLPNGDWGPPQNLGPSVNTEDDEDFPNISPDGKTLYFSSRGHTSMGGYDIFAAEWNPIKKKWANVQNIGYPINTPEDNMNFRVSHSGKYGYISALRADGVGNLDIYRVDFKGVDPRYTVIKGHLSSKDTAKSVKNPFISVIDLSTGELYGNYSPNQESMRYVMILPPGRYNLMVEAEGFKTFQTNIDIHDKSSFRSRINKDIQLKPKQKKE